MAKATNAAKEMNPTPDEGGHAVLWPLGMLLLVIAVVFSGALVLTKLGLISSGLPGCGAESDCSKLADGVWGSIPGINWPVSFVGFSYFLGMLIAWATTARGGVSNALRWIARLGALISFGFIVVMISLDSFCLYCFIAHIANFAFWITLEMMPRPTGDHSFNAFMTVAFSFLAISALIALGQIQKRDMDVATGEQLQDELAATIAKQSQPKQEPPTPKPSPTPAPKPAPTVSTATESPAPAPAFTGRYLQGDPNAPVKLVIISDYQCPDCYKYEKQVMSILQSRDDVSLSVKHFPFNSDCNPYISTRKHGNACWAARAVETAGILGGNEAFWKMHEWLFDQKGNFTNQEITEFARSIGLDTIEFTRMISSPEVNALVREDVDEAYGYGVLFTPMIFVNGVEVKWYHIPQNLSSTINKVANAIATGQAPAETLLPPTANEKLILDWKDGRMRNISKPAHALSRGTEDADIDVVVWGEYTSENYMQRVHKSLMPLLEEIPNHSFSYRVFPMSADCNSKVNEKVTGFPYACMTARAIKAAMQVGTPEQAWAFHEWLIEYGPQIDEPTLMVGVAQAGMDAVRFQEALNSPAIANMVQDDVREGIQAAFRGPPAIFVNGRYIPRWSEDAGDRVLERVLEEAVREQDVKN